MIPISYKRSGFPVGPLAIDANSPQANGLIAYWPMIQSDSGMVAKNLVKSYPGTAPGASAGDLKWKNTTTPAQKSSYQYGVASRMPGGSTNYWQATGGTWGGSAVTFSIRAKFTTIATGTTQNNELFERDTDNASWGFQFQLAGPKPIFYIVNQVPAALSLTANTSLVVDRWYHIVGSYNLSTTTCKIYIDGKLDNSSQLSATSIRGTGSIYTVGATEANTRQVTGYLADARIYNKALTDSEVKDIYQNPTAIFSNRNIVSYADISAPTFNASQFFMVM